MPYVKNLDRNQLMMTSLDAMVDDHSIARVIDAFADSLDLEQLGFVRSEPAVEGRPSYDPCSMLKLYLYGYQNRITSSRKLQNACSVNIEVIWLVKGVKPDFRTISEFRRQNAGCMKKVFRSFNQLMKCEIDLCFQSVDGSKFIANNSRNCNFTASKLDDRILWLEGHIEEYMRLLEESDSEDEDPGKFSPEELEDKIREAEDRLNRYKGYRDRMETENLSQISTTDPDSRLMKTRNGFNVSYNIQTVVSSESHLISDFNVTNQVTDYGQLLPSLKDIKKEHPDEIIEAVSDKGYQSAEDMMACLENGIIPHVILPDGQDSYELLFPHEPAENCDPSTKVPEELKKCLRAGIIPNAYKDYIERAAVVERSVRIEAESDSIKTSPFKDEQEMKDKAAEGYFVRDAERNIVYCPAGNILRKTYITKKNRIRYVNKTACRSCPYRDQCFKGKKGFKEVEFNKDEFFKPNGNWLREQGKKPKFTKSHIPKEVRQFVKIVFRPDRRKMAERQCLSEHPFGTIKHSMGVRYLLLRGKEKVEAEFSLLATCYNIKRAISLIGFEELMRRIAASSCAFYSIFKVQLQTIGFSA